DGNNPAANAQDDNAIATDKQPLLPGATASFANYTSYSKGINGVMVDISRLAGVPQASDFECRIGNSDALVQWVTAPTPSVSLRPGAGSGGTARVTLIWPDQAITNTWLRIAVLATSRTGLTQPFVVYIGNTVGETGNSSTDAQVTVTDQLRIRQNTTTVVNQAAITNVFDINRDRQVGALDVLLARQNVLPRERALRLITAP
ncbi:MAG: hypothetical protein NZ552_07845, partial [Planctomycetes bacterium]|nr:hypothetical protein [Planctomycetota bacterium]